MDALNSITQIFNFLIDPIVSLLNFIYQALLRTSLSLELIQSIVILCVAALVMLTASIVGYVAVKWQQIPVIRLGFIILAFFILYGMSLKPHPVRDFVLVLASGMLGTLVSTFLVNQFASLDRWKRLGLSLAMLAIILVILLVLDASSVLDERLLVNMRGSLVTGYMVYVLTRSHEHEASSTSKD